MSRYESLVLLSKTCYKPIMTNLDPILKSYRLALEAIYGGRLERAVLFGSRARGDARPDSDYDVAVFIKGYTDLGKEADALSGIELDILENTGAVINSMPFREGEYDKSTSFMQEVRQDGLEL